MHEIITTLKTYAHDTTARIISCNDTGIRVRMKIASRGNEEWDLISKNIIHIDMSQNIIIEKTEFGGIGILSKEYVDSRNFDYGGNLKDYRVIKFIDNDFKNHILVIYGNEEFEKVVQ